MGLKAVSGTIESKVTIGTTRSTAWRDLEEEIVALKKRELLRKMWRRNGANDADIDLNGRRTANFGSNNYLGLASHPEVVEANCAATREGGSGAGASRLISGNHAGYARLERAISVFKGAESTTVFATGYMANLGTITALVDEDDLVLSDRLNHASLIDGCRLSKARTLIYQHRDVDGLSKLLESFRSQYRRALIVTDGLFSMDGDVAPLEALSRVAEIYDARLLVDDAHGTGVLGENGRGSFEHCGVAAGERVVQMGTLSKAFGSVGGFVVGPRILGEFLLNRARTLIYSTGLGAGTIAAAEAALRIAEREPARRERICTIAAHLRGEFRRMGLNVGDGPGPIIPIILGDSARTMKWTEALRGLGYFVPGVRPPTVPEGEARLRVTVMATHTDAHVDGLLGACAAVVEAEN